ncbi:vWA domain-containing protein [Patulibacter minatonensis]|uniref:vWA domain-containing protein n=1 Tax=Patulibacter minatonensis TaxID=298163 RepID=UPI000687549A|nr:VWA domain-containing protein [Patulibacter minatonensis]
MKRSYITIGLIAAVVVALAAVVFGGGGGDDGPSGSGTTGTPVSRAPAGALEVSFAYSPEKEALLKPLIDRFNADRTKVGGRQVFVSGRVIASGDAERRIAAGSLKPTVWSPAGSLWGRLLNFDADRAYVAKTNRSIVSTPLVIAMWEPLARALGWPKKQVSYADILKLATAKGGWGAVGHPEFGDFRLVHTNPEFSTAGLEAVVAEYYAAVGKKEGLTTADVKAARDKVRAIENSIVHYGDTTLFIEQQLRKGGPGYASAVAMEETTVAGFNRDRGGQPKLIALHPKEGTFFSDSPYAVLDAPWVTAEQKQGAAAFDAFLKVNVDADAAARRGFRIGTTPVEERGTLTADNGVDVQQQLRTLSLPEPRVMDALKSAWRADRKPANVLLVTDVSGSMNDEGRLQNAKDGLKAFFAQVSPRDRVGLVAFSDTTRLQLPLQAFSAARQRLLGAVQTLSADGGTSVYDATIDALRTVRNEAGKDDRINAVVLLTDGEDTDSRRSLEDAVRAAGEQPDSAGEVRIFTIAYSAGAAGSADALKRIAEASNGKAYTGDTDDIDGVYRSISSFF